jgi:nicotinic acid mononucleotide adenylyltransferase
MQGHDLTPCLIGKIKMSNIGFFGLTGNPPHFSHCYAIREALKQSDGVYISLVYKHPFNKSFIDYEHRNNMLELILKEYFSAQELSKIKCMEIDKEYFETTQKIPYSYNLLSLLKQKEPENNFKLIIGEDNYKPEVWQRFFNYKEIENEFGLIIIPDRNVHSTQIRDYMKNIDENKDVIIESCGQNVFHYMKRHDLY